MDVGGGSTEFILGQGEQMHFRHSFPLGAVRLMETIAHSDPPQPGELAATRDWLANFLNRNVRPVLAAALLAEKQAHARHHAALLVGVGGAATVLARMEQLMSDYDRDRIEAVRLSQARVGEWVNRLWSLPLLERRKITGLPAERADVALTGAAIYEAVMAEFAFRELRVTTRGLRFAAVLGVA
jgi:exopolyphosphatase/guanosine-5'-triphosphate,3'-diphosphate pyrophosphatase